MKLTLAILVPPPGGETASAIAVRLFEMGGHITGWQPESNGGPARAQFTFETEDARDRFVTLALDVAGVSVDAPLGP